VIQKVDISRRNLLRGLPLSGTAPVRPPWSIHEPEFLESCSACGECVKACPEGIIINGAAGYPEVDFRRGECTFCSECATACPEPVFSAEKDPVWHLNLDIDDQCLAKRRVICQTCGDICDQNAIRFRPRLGDVAIPEVVQQDCNGCGACVSGCPEDALVLGTRRPADGGDQHV